MTLSPSFNSGALPSLDLAVYDTDSLQGFHDRMEQAILLISQSPYARKIAQIAIDEDYVIVVEETKKDETQEQYKSRERGSVDHAQKIIFVRREDDLETLALTIFHELSHVSQRVACGIKTDSLEDHPLSLLKKLLMMEADARAQELAFALSLKDKYPALLDRVAAKAESLQVDYLIGDIRAGNVDTQQAMAARYRIYFEAIHMRKPREDALLAMMERLDAKTLQDKDNFSKTASTDDLFAAFSLHGAPYLTTHRNAIDPDNAFMTAVSAENFTRLQALWDIRKSNLGTAHETPWEPMVYTVIKPAPKAGGPAP